MKEIRDTPVQLINKGDVKDVLDFGQICLLFCFDFFFFSKKEATNSVVEFGGAGDISRLNTQRTGLIRQIIKMTGHKCY